MVSGFHVGRFTPFKAWPDRGLQSRRQTDTDRPYSPAADDPNRVVTVAAQSGKSGAEVSISYTNCKVIGNGSFGVVFAAKTVGKKNEDGTEEPESEIAIKKVLQDKRFKVRLSFLMNAFS